MASDQARQPVAERTELTANSWFSKRAQPIWERWLVPRSPFSAYLELGVGEGASMAWAAANLLSRNARMVGIDSWQAQRQFPKHVEWIAHMRDTAFRNLSPLLDSGRLRLYHMESRLALPTLMMGEQRFDLAYVDASHLAADCLFDMVLAWELLLPGGIMVIDDCHLDASRRRSPAPKVREAVAAWRACHADYAIVFEEHPQLAVEKLSKPPSRRQRAAEKEQANEFDKAVA